jgi:hypothetical protein
MGPATDYFTVINVKGTGKSKTAFLLNVYFTVLDAHLLQTKIDCRQSCSTVQRCEVIKSAVDRCNTREYTYKLFSLYFIRDSKTFLGIMWIALNVRKNVKCLLTHTLPRNINSEGFNIGIVVKYEPTTTRKKMGRGRLSCIVTSQPLIP